MRSQRLSLVLFALILVGSHAAGQEGPFSLGDVDKMNVEEKRQLFGTPMTRKLDDPSRLLDLYVRGLKDPDQLTQRKAVQSLGWFLLSLQDMRREGTPIPMDFSRLAELQQLLSAKLSSPDAEMRGAAIQALVHTGAPNPQVESVLLARLAQEPNDELKAAVIDRMTVAGYSSNAFTQTVLNSLLAPSVDVRNTAAKAVAEIKPVGALPRLSQALEQYPPSQFVIDAIARYGAEALPYVPQLEKLAGNESVRGDLRDHARRAIEAIRNPNPQAQEPAQPKVGAVALVDTKQAPAPAPPPAPAADTTPAPADTTPSSPVASVPPSTPTAEKPAPTVERKAPMWPWVVGMAALLAIVALILKRRA